MELVRTRFEVKRWPAGRVGRADRRRRIRSHRRNFQHSPTRTGSPTKSRVHYGMCAWCYEFLTGARACVCARVRVHRCAYACSCVCTCFSLHMSVRDPMRAFYAERARASHVPRWDPRDVSISVNQPQAVRGEPQRPAAPWIRHAALL